MLYPASLQYSRDHEWLSQDGDVAVIGITDFAQHELGDVVFINLPEVGDEVTAGEAFGDVESVKAVSDVMSPVTGEVAEINELLADEPERMNQAPYDSWFIRVREITDRAALMDADAYQAFVETC